MAVGFEEEHSGKRQRVGPGPLEEKSSSPSAPPRSRAAKVPFCGCGRPGCPSTQAPSFVQNLGRRGRLPFSLSELRDEIEALRHNLPPYVVEVGSLQLASSACDDAGAAVRPVRPWLAEDSEEKDEEGPWDLVVTLQGPEGDEAYGGVYRVKLHFDAELWPNHLALVRWPSSLQHALADDYGAMLSPFYKNLPEDHRGVRTVRLMLQALHQFLADPLASWGLTAETVVDRAAKALEHYRRLSREREDVIAAYAQLPPVMPELLSRSPKFQEAEVFAPGFLAARRQQQEAEEAEASAEAAWRAWRAVARDEGPTAEELRKAFERTRAAAKESKELARKGWRGVLETHVQGEVYSFPIFTEAFCDKFVEELLRFYSTGLPAKRPNSMNAYGIILNDIGLEPFIDQLQAALQPLGDLLWGPGPGSGWDGQHCFVVRYRAGEDLGLDMHTDDADVTFNVCLGMSFEGGGLQFCGMMGAPDHRKVNAVYWHVKGHCVCHLGRKRHGADDIESGERLNLILWNRSSTYRQTDDYLSPEYHKESGAPDKVCVSYTHDRDFGIFREYPPGKEKFQGKGWCPRKSFEYDGFRAEEKPEGFCESSEEEG